MGNHLVLLALLAAAPHSARAGWPTGALGFAGLLAGDPPHLQSDVLRTTVDGTTLRVEETVQLAGDQGALTLGVGDTEDDESGLDRDNKVEAAVRRGHPELRGDALDKAVNAAVAEAARAEPYDPDTWTLVDFDAHADGARLATRHAVTEAVQSKLHADGSWSFDVPAHTKTVTIRYAVVAVEDDLGGETFGVRLGALSTWPSSAPRRELICEGLGDRPATQVIVKVLKQNEALPAEWISWRFSQGILAVKPVAHPWTMSVLIAKAGSAWTQRTGDRRLARWNAPAAADDCRALSLARNWIAAERGHTFAKPELRAYFAQQPWYAREKEQPLTADDLAAMDKIKRLEKAQRCP